MKSGICQIVGKTIESVVVCNNNRHPKNQVFICFNDGTYFELYGDHFGCAGGVDRGGEREVKNYVKQLGGSIEKVYCDPFPEKGLKPDYGRELQRSGITDETPLFFYDITFYSIDFISPGSYSAMLLHRQHDKEFAVSFDFGDDVFAFMVSKIPSDLLVAFKDSVVGRAFPFSIVLPLPVKTVILECRLGSVQRGLHDSFIPLVIVHVT